MDEGFLPLVTTAAALGCGLMAGVFFAFSAFVMRALRQLPSSEGMAAMKAINVAVVNPWFLTVFLGTAAACLLLAVASLAAWQRPDAARVLAGSQLYLLGTFLVTLLFNVPRNDALAAADSASSDGVRYWATYLTTWTMWNHVRTAAALAAAGLLTLAV